MKKRLIFSGGLRYDKFEVEIKKGEGGKEDDNNLSPRFGVAYLITDYLKIRANYGEAFKMPSADELAGNYSKFGTNYIGNPNLDPEESKTYEGGTDFSYASLNISLTYFHTDFKDKIELDGGGLNRTWLNIGKAEMAGFEGELSYDIGTFFDWNFAILKKEFYRESVFLFLLFFYYFLNPKRAINALYLSISFSFKYFKKFLLTPTILSRPLLEW